MIRPKPTMEQMVKLPVWARAYIGELELEVASLGRDKKQLLEEREFVFGIDPNGESRITWEYLMEGAHSLPKYANVRFHTNLERDEYVTIRWNETEGAVDVNCNTTVRIEPRATNCFYIHTKGR